MIEISHSQAQRFIRQKLDGRLPDLQWTALQAHLESCTACRDYQRRLARVEQDLRRVLRSNFDRIPNPGEPHVQAIIERQQRKAAVQRGLTYASGAAAVVLVLILIVRGVLNAQQSPAIPASGVVVQPPRATTTPFPTPLPGEFRGVVAFESRHEGNSEIYLLNPGVAPENLTNDPAEDTSPAWSPDGEWIAFLSDRTGKREVFVMHIGGGSPVQLTDEPGINWQPPLSWSADGARLALTGVRTQQGGLRFAYLVPVDGSGPRTLAGTRDAYNPEFSPQGERLAYLFSDGTTAGVAVTYLDGSGPLTSTWRSDHLAPDPALGSGLDWSADGSALAYIAARPMLTDFGNPYPTDGVPGGGPPSGGSANESGSRVMAVDDLSDTVNLYYSYARGVGIAESRWSGGFRGVSWTPGGAVLYLEDLDDARANDTEDERPDGCWTLQARLPVINREQARTFPTGSLCIEGGIDRGSWTSDGRWLVVTAREPGDLARSLYAIRMPGRAFSRGSEGRQDSMPGTVVHLMAASLNDGRGTPEADKPIIDLVGADLPRVRPRVRGSSGPLAISPQPVRVSITSAEGESSPARSNMAQAPGQVVFSMQSDSTGVIAVVNPSGLGGRILTSSEGRNFCPRWSPDGSLVAFVSDRYSRNLGAGEAHPHGQVGNELFVIPARGEPAAPQPGSAPAAPDAERAGLISRAELFTRGVAREYALSDYAVQYNCPIWSPDGRYVAAFAEMVLADEPSRNYLVVLAVDGVSQSWAEPVEIPTGGPTWSPDSRRIIMAQESPGEDTPLVLAFDLPGADGSLPPEITSPAGAWAEPDAVTLPESISADENITLPEAASSPEPEVSPEPGSTPQAAYPAGAGAATAVAQAEHEEECESQREGSATGGAAPASQPPASHLPPSQPPASHLPPSQPPTFPPQSPNSSRPSDPAHPDMTVTQQPGGLRRTVLRPPTRIRGVTGMAVSPDGWQVVLLSSTMLREAGAVAMIRRIDLLTVNERMPIAIGRDNTSMPAGRRALAWLPDDALGVVLRGGPSDRFKATIQRYDLATRTLETLALVEDVLYEAVWSPDGRWLLYSTESGLWGLDVDAARQGRAAPVWLSPVPVLDLDWK